MNPNPIVTLGAYSSDRTSLTEFSGFLEARGLSFNTKFHASEKPQKLKEIKILLAAVAADTETPRPVKERISGLLGNWSREIKHLRV